MSSCLGTRACRGGAIPIGREAWGDHLIEQDEWVLAGVPYESVAYDGNIINARAVYVPLIPVDEAPPGAGDKAKNQFYARLKDDSVAFVTEVFGMSGGPIFAMKKIEGALKYAVIGVQSAWYKNSRVIAACAFSLLGFALEHEIDEGLKRQGPNGA